MAKKKPTTQGQKALAKTMHERKAGTLHSGKGGRLLVASVRDKIAIACAI